VIHWSTNPTSIFLKTLQLRVLLFLLNSKTSKNGKTKEELNQVIKWFTGFDQKTLHAY
tara:strand:+ start:205 stop:378 length:174 start_codon:yes stop_codon:yes gene_type:complete